MSIRRVKDTDMEYSLIALASCMKVNGNLTKFTASADKYNQTDRTTSANGMITRDMEKDVSTS